MECPRCGSNRLERLVGLGQGTSRRFVVGCQGCQGVFRSSIDPDAAAACQRQIEANQREAADLVAQYAELEPGTRGPS